VATFKPDTVQPRPTAGIKIAKPGFNVETATDYELSFSTSWPSLAVAFTKTMTIVPGMLGPGIGQFDHPLKFPPFTMSWVMEGGIVTRRTFPIVTDKTIFINDALATGTAVYYTQCYNLDISKQISYNFIPPPPLAIGGKYDNNYGVKFAKPGKNINSHDLNDFIFHSRAMSPAIFVVNTTFDSGAKTITFHSPRDYTPWVFGYEATTFQGVVSWTPALPYVQAPPRLFIGPTTAFPSLVKGDFLVDCEGTATGGSLIVLRDPLFVANTVNVTYG
jgi:hypothetical protein